MLISRKPLLIVAGAGAFGTALANSLCKNPDIVVRLLSVEQEVVESINRNRINSVYFPNIQLLKQLKATTNNRILEKADAVFLAVPSSVLISYLNTLRPFIPADALIINLAKGFGENNVIISQYLEENFSNPTGTMKGASFAIEVLNNMPTGYTFASKNPECFDIMKQYAKGTNIHLDYSDDILGVELLSILKNIYAIIIGIVDAHFASANTRFLVSTKVFNELRKTLLTFGGNSETIFKYCGYGDFNLTSLNDLSRNRTMGLFIGKGFIKNITSDKITLEGKRSLNIFYDKLKEEKLVAHPEIEFPIMFELYKLMNKEEYDQRKFIYNIVNVY
ncbi:MAG: 2-dehydropantoate 2-reductase N-terminal domain-containing protein [Bacteroidales bacterium]|nr:2-dehydropantoate 2-reductase N-terminal domain-containing protein [Bacteroidales bacterium]